jgi:alcohol dehydrogenase
LKIKDQNREWVKRMFVSDYVVVNAGWLEKVTISCKKAHLPFAIFIDVTTNPKDSEVEAGCRSYISMMSVIIFGIGGGSELDVEKGSQFWLQTGTIRDYEGVDKIHAPLPNMVMVMTTAESVSDVSQFSVIVDSEHEKKMTIISKTLIPDIAIGLSYYYRDKQPLSRIFPE